MQECCRQRKNATCIGAQNDGPAKEMMCRECKTTWHELVNPEAGPELLEACEELMETYKAALEFFGSGDPDAAAAYRKAKKAVLKAEGK
jgi:hypothetical protein